MNPTPFVTVAGIVQAALLYALALVALVASKWPRDPDGSYWHPERVARWMEERSMREPPRHLMAPIVAGLMLWFTVLAHALSR